MRQLAKEKNLATQMGNQGSAEDGLRRAVEVIQAGVIGKPLELHVWTNRPIWPQGLEPPAGEDPVPAKPGLGFVARRRASKRPYKDRTSISRSTGAAGMTSAPARWATWPATRSTCLSARCKLGYPNVVECELASRMYPETFPKTSRIRFEFPRTRRPAAAQVLVVRRQSERPAQIRSARRPMPSAKSSPCTTSCRAAAR